MAFLKKCFALFAERFAKPPATSPSAEIEYSLLCRYIFQNSHFSKINNRVKPGAFLPSTHEQSVSAAWIDGLSNQEIWGIGDILGALRRVPASPRARADFNSEVLPNVSLTIEPDPKPHPRHVNLSGWPVEKDAQKDIAQVLCNSSALQVR